MRIIAFRTLKEFWENPKYADTEASLRSWYHEAKNSAWKNSNELKRQYKNASIIGDSKIVFNIKGNKFRLVVSIDYDFQVIYILDLLERINNMTSLTQKQFDHGNKTN